MSNELNISLKSKSTPTINLQIGDEAKKIITSDASSPIVTFVATGEKGEQGIPGTAAIGSDSVTSTEILDGTITSAQIQNFTISTNDIGAQQITSAKIGTGAVTRSKISNDAVDSTKLADNSVGAEHIIDGTIVKELINDLELTSEKLADGSITTIKVAENAITKAKILDKTITGQEIEDDVVLGGIVHALGMTIDGASPGYLRGPADDIFYIQSHNDLIFVCDSDQTSDPDVCHFRFQNAGGSNLLVIDESGNTTLSGNLDITGNITISGTVDGVDVNTALTTTTAQQLKMAYITVTQPVNLDTLESNVATNNAKVGITTSQANAIVANTAKTGITSQQATDITTNNSKVTFPGFGTTAGTALEGNTTIPTVPTLIDSDTMTGALSTNIASAESIKAYVDNEVSGIVDSAPGTLNTLNELAAALNDDASFSTTVTNSIALKAPIASPTFTGTVAIPNIADVESAITTNTAKTGITTSQANAITANTAKPDLTVDGAGTINANNVPTLNQNTSGTAAGLSSTLAVGSGGTGAATFTSGQILRGNGTSALTADTNLRFDGSIFAVISSTSARPAVYISNTNTDAEAPSLIFDRTSVVGADGDDIGVIKFDAEDDVGAGPHTYAQILGEIADASDGAEEGKLTFSVASHDAELQPGLIIQSGDAEDEVDITIGNGSTSVVNVAGDLSVTGNVTMGKLTANTSGSTLAGVVSVGTQDGDDRLYIARYRDTSTIYPFAHIYAGLDGLSSRCGFKIVVRNNSGTLSDGLKIDGNTKEVTFGGVINGTKLNTGQGDNELYAMNQDVETSDNVTFASVAASTHITIGGGPTPAASIRTSKVVLSTADCNTLHSTPVTVAPAAGADTVIVPVSGMIRVDRAATQTNSSADLNFHYDGTTGAYFNSSMVHFRRFMWNETGDRVFNIAPLAIERSQSLTEDVNKHLVVSVDSALTNNCFTSVTIFLTYHVFDIS